jgi:hypothetical protein
MSALLIRHPRQRRATEADAAIEAARYERAEQHDDLMAMCSLAQLTADRSGDADAIRRVRHARSLLSEMLNLGDR